MAENEQTEQRIILLGPDPEMLDLLDDVFQDAGFSVVQATFETISETIRTIEPQVVICDEVESMLDGVQLFESLSADLNGVGFVLIGDDPDGERIAALLRLGITDHVVKPFDVDELIARVERAITVSNTVPAETSDEIIGFSGDLDYLNLPDILINLHQNTRTGVLKVQVEEGEYRYSFARGELVKTMGPNGLKSKKAFYRAMRVTGGTFKFVVAKKVRGRRSEEFENLANVILHAVQEADEYPLTRNNLPADPIPVSLSGGSDDKPIPNNSAIQPLLEGLIKSTTIDILIHASPKTDLKAARELEDLMRDSVLVETT